ncbi:uncharacterized protein LOC122298893 [Carya illinoinensis]|uniref:uncharacterized protein LOC122298893 n=1 Tax=Carya illinoinensis TaxID=32201 RepID=UPI001C71EC35|nr:uncharacterized protein LOC122298893 [Carya illinoinensis]
MLEAKLGFNSSYAWRSLYSSLRLLKKGLFWRIGDGKKVKIWGDKWIPRDYAPKVQRTWQKPNEGVYKINWDAATKNFEGSIGIGVIARDFEVEMGLSLVILEGDAIQVVSMANKAKTDLSLGGLIIAVAKGVLTALRSWSVVHTNREANMAAHILARFGLDLEEDKYTLEEIPSCIQSIVLSDLM